MLSRRALALAVPATIVAAAAVAHPHETLKDEQIGHIEHQVMHARQDLIAAIAAKDVGKLRAIYAESFTHTHGSGKVDGRDARIVAVLAGEPVIETAKPHEITIRVMHADTAIVSGKSPILNVTEKRDYDFRWMQVWVRVGGDWRLAASQATRLPATS
jgi:hypothetical protein